MLTIETLVLLLILYEVIVGVVDRRNERKRQSAITRIVATLFEFMKSGRKLQASVSDPSFDPPNEIDQWIDSVKRWTVDTNAFLAQHSPPAAVAFLLVVNAHRIDSTIFSPNGQFCFTVVGHQRECYQQLLAQLDNLRKIIEKPEAYF
jgi:hypothetical protein